MLSAEVFAGHVRDALAHLYDRPYLRSHPLGSLLGGTRPVSEEELRRLLLNAVESLRPPEPCPPSSPAWRGYRYLDLRYVKGATPEQTARELQISVRQAQRERDRALDDVTSLLWERYANLEDRGLPAMRPRPQRGGDASTSVAEATAGAATAQAVEDELFKIGSLPSTEPVSLAEAMQDALDIVARLAEHRGARVDAVFPRNLPFVRVHRLVLRQVLIDLLESAIESQTHALIRVTADVLTWAVSLEISVPRADSGGAAAPPETDARLAATRKLIELQGGKLTVEKGGDVSFRTTVWLPLKRARTLLVIDDNPDVAFLFSRLLRDQDYRIIQASTGPAALRLAREARPNVITLDVLMPSQDGWDLLRTLESDPDTRQIPVIVCSVIPERSLALSLGVAGFLNKPVTREALLGALHSCDPTQGPS